MRVNNFKDVINALPKRGEVVVTPILVNRQRWLRIGLEFSRISFVKVYGQIGREAIDLLNQQKAYQQAYLQIDEQESTLQKIRRYSIDALLLGGIALVLKHKDKIVQFLTRFWETVSPIVSPIFSFLKTTFFDRFRDDLKVFYDFILEKIDILKDIALSWLVEIKNYILDELKLLFKKGVTSAFDRLKISFSEALNFVDSISREIREVKAARKTREQAEADLSAQFASRTEMSIRTRDVIQSVYTADTFQEITEAKKEQRVDYNQILQMLNGLDVQQQSDKVIDVLKSYVSLRKDYYTKGNFYQDLDEINRSKIVEQYMSSIEKIRETYKNDSKKMQEEYAKMISQLSDMSIDIIAANNINRNVYEQKRFNNAQEERVFSYFDKKFDSFVDSSLNVYNDLVDMFKRFFMIDNADENYSFITVAKHFKESLQNHVSSFIESLQVNNAIRAFFDIPINVRHHIIEQILNQTKEESEEKIEEHHETIKIIVNGDTDVSKVRSAFISFRDTEEQEMKLRNEQSALLKSHFQLMQQLL